MWVKQWILASWKIYLFYLLIFILFKKNIIVQITTEVNT